MFKIFDMIFFFGVLIFLGWVFVGSTPGDRMSRTCAPIGWAGSLAEAGTEVFTSPASSAVDWVREKTADIDYGCQYIVWRTFYASPEQIAAREAAAEAEAEAQGLTQGEAEEAAVEREVSKQQAAGPAKDSTQKDSTQQEKAPSKSEPVDPLEEGAWVE